MTCLLTARTFDGAADLRTRVFDVGVLSALQIESWEALLSRLRVPSPFLSYAFCRAVNDVRDNVRVLQLENQTGIAGFLPFQMKSAGGILGHAEKPGGGLSDMFGVVGACDEALDAEALLRCARISALRFDHGVPELCPFACEDSECTLGVRVRVDDFGAYVDVLKARDKDFVKAAERGRRQLERDLDRITFVWHAVDPHPEIERLIASKREQYRRTGKPDGFAEEWRKRLLHRLADLAPSASCQLVMSSLYCGGTWVASNLSLACHNTLHIWYPVYDARFRRYGPGHILFFDLLRHGHERGMRWFDFGQGESSYKLKYGGEVYLLWKGVIRRRTLMGLSERILQSLQWRFARYRTGNWARRMDA